MKVVKKTMFFLFIFFIFACISIYAISFFPKITLGKSNDIIIYDNQQNILISKHYENEGKYLEISEINEDFIICFIANEDKNFYQHNGFSFKGIVRALINNITSNSTQGGSTITQQLSRSLFLDNEKSIFRKIKEGILTIRIEHNYDKKNIIEQYLNSIYLGHDIYGIEQASNYYFNKTNKKLSLDEIALIVGIANAPNINAPDINYENAIKKRNQVLNNLYEQNYINQELYYKLINKKTNISINDSSSSNINNQLYYYIKNKLIDLKLYNKEILAKGINVYTTIDSKIHNNVYEIITKNNNYDTTQISTIVMEPNTGNVLSIFGSYDINDQYNRAIYSKRPVGSTIKPLLYYLALKCNMTPFSEFSCKKTIFNVTGYEPYCPTNANNKYADDKLNMIQAIALSDNVYATKTLLYVGFENFEKLLSLFDINIKCVLASALGVDELSLLELTSIYNCFASLGTYYKPRIISKITDSFGNVLYTNSIKSNDILDKDYVKVLNQLLTAPFDTNLIDYTTPTLINYKPDTCFAAKTGSNESNCYTIGYNPNYTISIWNGNDDNSQIQSSTVSKTVFKEIANKINDKNIWYVPSKNIKINYVYFNNSSQNNDFSIYWSIK